MQMTKKHDAPSGLVDAALLREVVDKGLIYWEPNTSRGAVAKADMLARCELALSGQQGGAVPETYWKGDVTLVGPVDGMNEKHPDGSYFRLVATQGEEKRHQILFSRGAAEALRDELIVALERVGRGQQGGAVPAGDLPSVEAFAEALWEEDREWPLRIRRWNDATPREVTSYHDRASKLRARLAEQLVPAEKENE